MSFKIRRAVVLYTEFSSEQVIQIHVFDVFHMFQLFLILSPEGSCEGCFTFSERLKLNIDAFNRITSLISYSNVFFLNNK